MLTVAEKKCHSCILEDSHRIHKHTDQQCTAILLGMYISSMTSLNKFIPLSPNVGELVNVRKSSYVIIQSGVLFA